MADEKEIEKQIGEFQNLQRQLQMVSVQKQQIQIQLEEIKLASEELGKSKGAVFKAAGNMLFETSKDEAEKELKERKEALDTRVSMLSKQEEKIRARLTELKPKLDAALKGKGSS